ncbi:MAG TPA: TauD/TfdA family dioxygenase [Streptosporangiaceae bacterium]|jgi:hypothetical protein|nr:TauD/TfdA family dioxygenase [Streptosporangiaceae bacterium]
MCRAADQSAGLFTEYYVDLAEPAAEATVVQRLRDAGLVTFGGLARRNEIIAFASSVMAMTAHRDSDPDGLTTIRDIPRLRDLTGYSGLGRGELLPHTDGSSLPEPPRLMMLVCERPADRGGECLLIDGQRLHADLSVQSQEAAVKLSQPRTAYFGAGNGHATQVFTVHPGGRLSIRLRQDDLAHWSPVVAPYVPYLRDAISRHQHRLTLTTGQGYLVDNHRWLHARTGFSGDRRFLRALGDPHIPLAPGFVIAAGIDVSQVASEAA